MRVLKPLVFLGVCGAAAFAQGPQLAAPPFSSLVWRNIGPTALGGHVDRVAVGRVKGQPDQIYAIGTTGGAFKSVTGGVTWKPVFDEVNAMMSTGDIVVAPSNPSIVWIGTGESSNSPYYWGDGIYKSVDGAKTWTNMGLKETRHIGRILIHPTNPDIVWVAAQGHIWGSNAERGVFKTTDGGRTWRRVLSWTYPGSMPWTPPIRPTPRSSSRRRTSASERCTAAMAADRDQESINPSTAARRGRRSPPVCPPSPWVASDCTCRLPTRRSPTSRAGCCTRAGRRGQRLRARLDRGEQNTTRASAEADVRCRRNGAATRGPIGRRLLR